MKYDGYRCQAAVAGDQVTLYSRSGIDRKDKFGFVAPPLRKLTKGTLLLDGEICAIDERGRSNFSLLKTSLDGQHPIVFSAFDLLEQDSENVALRPQLGRKLRLEQLLASQSLDSPLQYSPRVVRNGQPAASRASIAKGAALYGGRPFACIAEGEVQQAAEFVVIGWRPPEYGADDVRGLFLGTYEDGKLVYRGSVGTGFMWRSELPHSVL